MEKNKVLLHFDTPEQAQYFLEWFMKEGYWQCITTEEIEFTGITPEEVNYASSENLINLKVT
jgi:hypothetical protein